MNKGVTIYLHQGKNRTPMTEGIRWNEMVRCDVMLENIESEFDGETDKAMRSPRWLLWRTYQRQLELYDDIPF